MEGEGKGINWWFFQGLMLYGRESEWCDSKTQGNPEKEAWGLKMITSVDEFVVKGSPIEWDIRPKLRKEDKTEDMVLGATPWEPYENMSHP